MLDTTLGNSLLYLSVGRLEWQARKARTGPLCSWQPLNVFLGCHEKIA